MKNSPSCSKIPSMVPETRPHKVGDRNQKKCKMCDINIFAHHCAVSGSIWSWDNSDLQTTKELGATENYTMETTLFVPIEIQLGRLSLGIRLNRRYLIGRSLSTIYPSAGSIANICYPYYKDGQARGQSPQDAGFWSSSGNFHLTERKRAA